MSQDNDFNSVKNYREAVNLITEQLCASVNNDFKQKVEVESPDLNVQKLVMLINFLLDFSSRSISDIQKAYETIRSEQQFRLAVFESALSGMIIINREFTIISMNPAAERLLGYIEQEILGVSISVLVPEFAAIFEQLCAKSKQGHLTETQGLDKHRQDQNIGIAIQDFYYKNQLHYCCFIRNVSIR